MSELVAIEKENRKNILKEQEAEEEEEEEDYDISKGKTTVKFVVEPGALEANSQKVVIESSEKTTPTLIHDKSGLIDLKPSLRSLQLDEEGLIEGHLINEPDHKQIKSVEPTRQIVTVNSESSDTTESIPIESQLAEKLAEETMRKAFQDAANTFEDEEDTAAPVQRLQKSPELIEHDMGTFYPQEGSQSPAGQPRKVSPAQLSPVKVYLHSSPNAPKDITPEPTASAQKANNVAQQPPNLQRPQWSAPPPPQPPISEPKVVPIRPKQIAAPKSPISHQKLADQVAQKAIINNQTQEQTRQKLKENKNVQQPAPEVTRYSEFQQAVPPSDQYQYQYQQQQRYYPDQHQQQQQQQFDNRSREFQEPRSHQIVNQNAPRCDQISRPFVPPPPTESESRDQSLERRMRLSKIHDPACWVVQESVTASQMVKGAPWARHQVEKREKVWPPPPPKAGMASIDQALSPHYGGQQERYESSGQNAFYQKYQDIYDEENDRKLKQSPRVPQDQQQQQTPIYHSLRYEESQPYQPSNAPQVPPAPFQDSYTRSQSSFQSTTYERSPGPQQQYGQPNFGYTPQPMQKFVSHPHEQQSRPPETQHVQKFDPVRPVPFNPQQRMSHNLQQGFLPRQIRPDLNQPLTLDTQNLAPQAVQMHQLYHQQLSPKTVYKPQGPFGAEDVSAVIPPSRPNTSTPVLPFTKPPEQQDYDKFQSQYSPGRMIYNVQPESYQYVTNQVASVPGGTSFARVQNTSRINFDPNTGDPYKENIQRVVRTTRTVPKSWKT